MRKSIARLLCVSTAVLMAGCSTNLTEIQDKNSNSSLASALEEKSSTYDKTSVIETKSEEKTYGALNEAKVYSAPFDLTSETETLPAGSVENTVETQSVQGQSFAKIADTRWIMVENRGKDLWVETTFQNELQPAENKSYTAAAETEVYALPDTASAKQESIAKDTGITITDTYAKDGITWGKTEDGKWVLLSKNEEVFAAVTETKEEKKEESATQESTAQAQPEASGQQPGQSANGLTAFTTGLTYFPNKEQLNYSGPAVVQSLAAYYGKYPSQKEIAQVMKIPENGVATLDYFVNTLTHYFASEGLRYKSHNQQVSDSIGMFSQNVTIDATIRRGEPLITLINLENIGAGSGLSYAIVYASETRYSKTPEWGDYGPINDPDAGMPDIFYVYVPGQQGANSVYHLTSEQLIGATRVNLNGVPEFIYMQSGY